MTAFDIVRIVQDLESASREAIGWMSPGGICCLKPRAFGYCTNPGCIAAHEQYSRYHATEAAHAAGQLMAIAEAQS